MVGVGNGCKSVEDLQQKLVMPKYMPHEKHTSPDNDGPHSKLRQ